MSSSARCAAGPIPERIRIALGAGRQDDLPRADLLAIEQADAGGATAPNSTTSISAPPRIVRFARARTSSVRYAMPVLMRCSSTMLSG
jgi:hypothetical protein